MLCHAMAVTNIITRTSTDVDRNAQVNNTAQLNEKQEPVKASALPFVSATVNKPEQFQNQIVLCNK